MTRRKPVATGTTAQVTCLADVEPEEIRWLWQDRIPLGKLTLLDGDPGKGKSTVLLDIAARGSQGLPMPDGSAGQRFATVLLSAEDGLGDTIRNRLLVAGADVTRIHAMTGIGLSDGQERLPAIPEDVPQIEALVERLKGGGAPFVMVCIDPLAAYLGSGIDAHKDSDVRRALHPLADMANRTGSAIVIIRHLNKSGGGSALYRGGGSIGITGAARSVLLVAQDPDDPEGRVLASVKANLSRLAPALTFRLAWRGTCAQVDWTGSKDTTADELCSPSAPAEPGAGDEARAFLLDLLSAGPVLATEAMKRARAEMITTATLKRARKNLSVVAEKVQGSARGAWMWRLPKGLTDRPGSPISDLLETVERLGPLERQGAQQVHGAHEDHEDHDQGALGCWDVAQ